MKKDGKPLVRLNVTNDAPTFAREPRGVTRFAEPYRLGKRTESVLHAMIDLLVPSAPAPRTPALLTNVAEYVRGFMAYMPALARLGLVVAMWLLDWSPRWMLRSRRKLTELPRSKANAIIERIGSSKISYVRTLVVGVRGLILSGYFDQPEVHEAIGYAPIPFMAERVDARRALTTPAHAAA